MVRGGRGGPTWTDLAWQWAYRAAYPVLRPLWHLAQPEVRGAFVALWHRGRILLIQNSYASFRSLPGGMVSTGETPADAALREVREEVGVTLSREQMTLEFEVEQRCDGKRDRVWLYCVELEVKPSIRIDHREVVEARFVPPEVAVAGPLFPPARRHIEERLGRRQESPERV